MKKKLLFIFISCIIITLVIYATINTTKINYLSLGDGIALGINPYDQKDYGYSDYLKDYLKSSKKLKNYYNFSKEDLRIIDLIDMLEDNSTIKNNKKSISINEAINNADIITIALGSTDIYNKLKLNNIKYLYTETSDIFEFIDKTIKEYEICIKNIKKIYHKDNLILIGLYNPIVNNEYINNKKIEEIFNYIDQKLQQVTDKYNLKYINTNKLINRNSIYFPNPNSIHINKKGYNLIYKEILKKLEL